MKRVLIIDTSILCVWLQVPGKETCGSGMAAWDYTRVNAKIEEELKNPSMFVLPLATIIETGNHISQSKGDCFTFAQRLSEIMIQSADNISPWVAFSESSILWTQEKMKELAQKWPALAAQRISLGDATIKDVAEYYAQNFEVEIFTADEGLKAYEPVTAPLIPRRKR